jgi:hypothetical protein
MNIHALEEIARQRHRELHEEAVSRRAGEVAEPARRQVPLRVRTGWTLVGLGLKLAVPAQRQPVRPGTAGTARP